MEKNRYVEEGRTKLSQACLNNDEEWVDEILRDEPYETYKPTWNQAIALHIAVKFTENINIIRKVLDATPENYRHSSNWYHNSVYDYASQRGEDTYGDTEILLSTKNEVLKMLREANIY